ncbi:MAG TPA: Rieske 2Fe-2S domain-containing protein [Symbiobacteriaceae bacterium]|nr:Rieske 2Fe-2S domain-containing protein [Symbiobacteriaceae bacterium]
MEMTRREALRSAMFSSIGLMFSGAAGGAGAFLWPAKVSGFGGLVTAPVKLSEIKVGDVIPVREGKFYLTRTDDGLLALYWKCVHLGCTVPWNEAERQFKCPCHRSTYEITGQNIAGPATRPLDLMEITVEGEQITVNTGKIRTRRVYEPEQAFRT